MIAMMKDDNNDKEEVREEDSREAYIKFIFYANNTRRKLLQRKLAVMSNLQN